MMIGSGKTISNNMNNKNYRVEATLCWISTDEPEDYIFIGFQKISSKESRDLGWLHYYPKLSNGIENMKCQLSKMLLVCSDLRVDAINIEFSYDLWKPTKDTINKFSNCTGIEIVYWDRYFGIEPYNER